MGNINEDIRNEKRNILFKCYFEEFFKPGLVTAINIKDEFPYYKQIKIFQNLPFLREYTICKDWKKSAVVDFISKNFSEPIWDKTKPELTNFYLFLNRLFDEYDVATETCRARIKKVIDFALKNKNIMEYNIDDYGNNVDEEYQEYQKNKIIDFKDIKTGSNENKKRLNRIGELLISDRMFYESDRNKTEIFHVAKRFGNGFGYKIYECTKNKEEILHNVNAKLVNSNKIKIDSNTVSISKKDLKFIESVLDNNTSFVIDNLYINENDIHSFCDLKLQVKRVKNKDSIYEYFLVNSESKTVYKQDKETSDEKKLVFRGKENQKMLLTK